MAQEYIPYMWQSGEPITQEKMRHIEEGIAAAQGTANTSSNRADDAWNKADSMSSNINSISTIANRAEDKADQALRDVGDGKKAWVQIAGVVTIDPNTQEITKNLATYLNENKQEVLTKAESAISIANSASGRVDLLNTEITGARKGATNLQAKMDSVDTAISLLEGAITTIQQNYSSAKGNQTDLNRRLNAIDGNPPLINVSDYDALIAAGGRVGKLETEITNARGTYTDVDARLDAMETATGTLDSNVVKYSDIQNVLTAEDTNKPLSAAKGKELKDTIGGSYNTTNTVAAGIVSAANTAEANAKNYADSILGQGFDTTNTVAAAVTELTDTVSNLDTSTDGRLDAIEETLSDALVSTVVRTPGAEAGDPDTDTTYGSLDARLEAIESHAATVRTDLNTIATELAMVDDVTHNIKDTNTKIDDLTADVSALASEINMGHDEFGRLTGAETRIDTLAYDVSHEATQEDQTIGLTQRITAIETDITKQGGINDRLDAIDNVSTGAIKALHDADDELDSRLNAIDGGTALTGDSLVTRVANAENAISHEAGENDPGGLTERLTVLEQQPKSATEVITEDYIEYDSNGNPTIYTSISAHDNQHLAVVSGDKDYLLQNGDKYYYWKYLGNYPNGTWELISGGGGSGTGNNNAEDYNTVAAFEIAEKEENKDYYVLESDNIRHHYRYLKSIGENDVITWTPIEIGVPTNTLKSYQIARTQVIDELTQTSTDYLDFYGFDFGVNVSSDDVDTVQNYESYRIGRIELPKGGGGENVGGHRIYAKVRGDQAQRIAWSTAQNNGVRINYGYTCYSFNDLDSYDYVSLQGTLTDENNNIIETYNVPYLEYADYTSGVANITTKNLLQYCAKNETKSFTLTLHANIPNETIADKTLTVSITLVELALTSTFSDQQTYSINNNLVIPYEFSGMSDQSPTFEILFDNNTIAATVTATNIIIRKESLVGKQGIHNLTIRAYQQVGGSALPSDPLTYQLGLVSGTNDTLMLFSGMSLQTLYNEQYKLLKLPYYLYVPNGEKTDISFVGERLTYNDSHVITNRESVSELNRPTENLGTGSYNYSFRLHDMIADIEYYAVTITAGEQSLVFYITMNKAAEQINIKTDNLMFDFKPERYSNNVENEALRLWSDTNNGVTYKMRIPDGAHFDWRTGGWMTIDDVPCFCVKAGSRVEFVQESNGNTTPLTLFWQNMETLGGSNFKCTFKIDNVKTPNTPFLTSLDTVTNTIVNYGKTILASKQDIEDDDTLLHTYLNTKYIYTATINSSNKTVKEAIGKTVLNSTPFDNVIDNTARAAAEVDARNSNKKKIKKYISNIYDIANQASTQAHREYLLKKLSGKANDATIDYSTIKNEITSYLFDEALYDAGNADNTNATNVYNTLVSESNDDTSVTYAYRQVEPVNFDALLNGFVVEGKAGKDGIIAMILFTFASTIKTGGTYTQTVSATPISTNSFDKTGTFEVQVTDTVSNETKTYEVDILDEESNGNYTEIISIKDASNTETRAYGLELNALGSNIYLPSGVVSYAHSEGDVIEFEYNVNPEISGRVNSSIIIYEDGVPSAAKLYTSRNGIFEQSNPGCLTIGSDECDVYIYKMRLYSQALNNEDILANFYADGLTTDDMMDRYNRNKNLVNAATITPQLVAAECPDLRIIMIEAPNLTGGKTSFIKNTKIRQIYKNGRPEDNWVALNAYHAGQGTSSDNYGAAGRNLDIMFGFDGKDTVIVPKPQKNNYTFDPNYKSIIIKGLDSDDTNDILTAEEYEAAGYDVYYNDTNKEPGTVSLTDSSVPNNWFNIKVNIASSENTNNAYLQKRFDRYLPYDTPARLRGRKQNPKLDIKNDMEFFNCVIFIKETGTPSEFTEDKDLAASARPWHFYGIGNIGDSKKTDSTRVNVKGDPYEFCIEISDNGLKNSGFSSGVYYISEASKLRSQTPRNQTNGNADLDNIRNATSVHVCTDGEFTINDSSYIFSIVDPDDSALYLVPVSTEAFTYYRRFMHISAEWVEVGEPITFTRTSYGIKYPISNAEWTCSLNDYHKSLYDTTSGKGWDKSFEFRYDITTKDGETVARNDLEAAMNELHQQINKKTFADMYSWIVTASNEEFSAEFNTRAVKATSRWFIKQSPLYWYLFTERYTMIDSRAKNTFYHYGKVFISQEEYDGDFIAELTAAASDPATYATEHNITANGNVTAEAIATEEIQFRLNAAQFVYNNRDTFTLDDTQAAINNGYRFELWDYDNDTALGINNNGQMVFSAGLEDIDKDISGWIYNEAESVIWRRIRENTYDDLGALYVRLKGAGFNAENLIQEFDNMQNQFPEELWRLDFERKYYRPFIELGETTYLNDMANGRKRYQRRQFERNMAIYINSKYQRNGSYNENDIISFRPQFTWTAGRNTQITVKPYSTMYINFMLGNDDQTGQSISQRVQRGESYVIDAADYIHDFNNIQCIIYNASRIMELDGLGNFECKQFILGAAKKLSVLKLGSVEYPNRSMADINNMGLSDGLPLLEELDLTNIQFGTAPDTFALDNFPLLKKLNATGCNIRSFTFKDGGMLEKIIFPAVLTRIDFQNLYKLIDTYNDQNELESAVILTGAANLISYNSVNSYTNSYQIVQNMLNNAGQNGITQLKLNDIIWTINDLIELEPLVQLKQRLGDNMLLQGTITVTGNWSTVKLNDYKNILGINNIIWNTDSQKQIQEYKLSFYLSVDDYNNNNIYYSKYIQPAPGLLTVSLGSDPVYVNECPMPTKESTISTAYYFGTNSQEYLGWRGWRFRTSAATPSNNSTIQNDTEFIAIFGEEPRKYPLYWYLTDNDDDTTPVKTVNQIAYGSSYEDGIAPTVLDLKLAHKQTTTINTIDGINCTYGIFKGWQKEPINLDSTFLHTIPNSAEQAFCIYGDWERGTTTIEALKNAALTDAKKLLLLSNIEDGKQAYPINSTFNLTMGQDRPDGIVIIGPNATENISPRGDTYTGEDTAHPILSFSYDSQNATTNPPPLAVSSIKPFADMTSHGFTLVIDYQLNTDYINSLYGSQGYVVIGGCYTSGTNDTTQGFALYYDCAGQVSKVCFGNLANLQTYNTTTYSCAITNQNSTNGRNIVVIRHQTNSDKLEVYSGISATNGILINLNNSFRQELTWSKNTSNAPLCFGHFTTDTFTSLSDVHPGAGVSVHWAKYWNNDLGYNACIQLASWPHEKLRFAVEDYSNDGELDVLSTNSQNIIFSALQLSQYGGPQIEEYSRTPGTTVSWGSEINAEGNSLYKRIANYRFFLGLPIPIQSIITETYGKAAFLTENYTTYHTWVYTTSIDTTDLAFLPTYYEVGGTDSNYTAEAKRPMPWCNSANSSVYTYDGTAFDRVNVTHSLAYMNLRFFGVPINHNNNRIYKDYTSNTPVYNKIEGTDYHIQSGDIFIHKVIQNGNETNTAYIYADALDKAAGAPTIIAQSGDVLYCPTGGWVKAQSWWTRSAAEWIETNNTSQPFYYVEANTGVVAKRSTPAGGGAYFAYSFGV